MIGKADIMNLPQPQFFPDPVFHTLLLQNLPGLCIVQHVHQIIIHMIRLQPAQLFLKTFLQPCPRLDQIMWQFRGNVYLISASVSLQDLAQRRLAAMIHISSIKIVYTISDRFHDLFFCLFKIDLPVLFCKTQTAITKYGQFCSLFILPILQSAFLLTQR